jgi:flagellin-like hook-associated protein FlgL
MASIINDNTSSLNILNYYNRSADNMQKSMFKIASGMKINRAADNPSDWAISERMRDSIRAMDQADQNIQNDTSLLKVAEGAISNTIEIIQTLRAKAVEAANDHATDEDRANIQKEAESLLKQIDSNSTVTFNGKTLLDGTQLAEGLNFHVGGEVNFAVTLKLENMSVKALGLDALDLSTREGAQKALGVDNGDGTYSPDKTITDPLTGEIVKIYGLLDMAFTKAVSIQTTIGTMEDRLGYARETLNATNYNTQAASSALVDTDEAKEMVDFTHWNIIWQADGLLLSQENKNGDLVLKLLEPVQ